MSALVLRCASSSTSGPLWNPVEISTRPVAPLGRTYQGRRKVRGSVRFAFVTLLFSGTSTCIPLVRKDVRVRPRHHSTLYAITTDNLTPDPNCAHKPCPLRPGSSIFFLSPQCDKPLPVQSPDSS